MENREAIIRQYFGAWLIKDGAALTACFAQDALYVASHGPVYSSLEQIERWFADWNMRGDVSLWDIDRFIHHGGVTAVEWRFECRYDGKAAGCDGVSLVHLNADG